MWGECSPRFVGDGQKILTAGADGTARLWSSATGSALKIFRGDAHFLTDATMAPDGSLVIAGGSDGLLRFWDASNERLLWSLKVHRSYVVGLHYEGGDIVTRAFAGDISRWSVPPPDKIIEPCHAAACAPVTPDDSGRVHVVSSHDEAIHDEADGPWRDAPRAR